MVLVNVQGQKVSRWEILLTFRATICMGLSIVNVESFQGVKLQWFPVWREGAFHHGR